MKGGEPPNPFAGSGATQDRQTQCAASLVAETVAPFAAGRSVLFCVTAQKLLPAACGAQNPAGRGIFLGWRNPTKQIVLQGWWESQSNYGTITIEGGSPFRDLQR